MHITKAIVTNYRTLRHTRVSFNAGKNIIVGDNEVGKSTLLEAINLALTGQVNGRSVLYDLHPFLFNQAAAQEFIAALVRGETPEAPTFQIELYFDPTEDLILLTGTNNSLRENVPGVLLRAELDDRFAAEYEAFIGNPAEIRSIPIEFYKVVWRNFAGNDLSPRSRPLKVAMIDTGDLRYSAGPRRYVIETVSDFLEPPDRAQISLSYRKMRDAFLAEPGVSEINRRLEGLQGEISDKTISVSLDSTAKGSWESGIVTNLDDIPFSLVGKGEQSSVKIQLAMSASAHCQIFLIEEPENHLSFTNLNRLITKIDEHADGRQIFLTTHSSFVLNKLDVGNVLLFRGSDSITLNELTPTTRDYFLKLPGHDTLRLILSSGKVILVEGPSDELIVQKAYLLLHERLPLEDGVDVISVNSLAFKRFLEISAPLHIETHVITDNDGDVAAVNEKYTDYDQTDCVTIHFDRDESYLTLEHIILRDNGRGLLNTIFGTEYDTDEELKTYMKRHKTDCALKIFATNEQIVIPQYIQDAIE